LRVWGSGCRKWGLGFKVQGSGSRFQVLDPGCRIQNVGFRIYRAKDAALITRRREFNVVTHPSKEAMHASLGR